jgi:hypothetical protein
MRRLLFLPFLARVLMGASVSQKLSIVLSPTGGIPGGAITYGSQSTRGKVEPWAAHGVAQGREPSPNLDLKPDPLYCQSGCRRAFGSSRTITLCYLRYHITTLPQIA